ncbi:MULTISPECIES: HesB/IscA family protein [Inquilinus]|jgi:iron-sulfur cluster assembly accessory protein|nr:iron-sulfur cluster assembly accessory protein [Inquilinus ginsengisoli]HMG50028.1 iron-sulfur cluster assembly accessory protein [Inquilinus sp.]
MRALPPPISLTDRAADRVRELIEKSTKPILGLRVGVKARGCSGLSYFMEYAEERKKFEDVVESKGVTVLIDPSAIMFLLGTEMDWVQEEFGARFVFNNPNEVDRCGCGESFRVAQPENKEPAHAGA